MSLKEITGGSVTSPKGFRAGSVYAGIKTPGADKRDIAILIADAPCVAAGVFTQNVVKAAPVHLSKKHISNHRAQAVVVNAGCANACTGDQGMEDALEMTEVVAKKYGLSTEDILVASTGVIGVNLPMDKVLRGIEAIEVSSNGGHDMARAIITTDTHPKEIAVTTEIGGIPITVGGIAKGAGMIHPNMATMLSFITTDAAISPECLRTAIKEAADASLNMITIDGDTSTNDTLVVLANGLAGNQRIEENSAYAEAFQEALDHVCQFLAKEIARDGEGAEKLIEVIVAGARSKHDARLVARTVAGSALFKSAVHGNDPNWGRILAAAGRSGADFEEEKTDVYIGDICLMKAGRPQHFDKTKASAALQGKTVFVRIMFNIGNGSATGWGCDLTEEYVKINSEYTT